MVPTLPAGPIFQVFAACRQKFHTMIGLGFRARTVHALSEKTIESQHENLDSFNGTSHEGF